LGKEGAEKETERRGAQKDHSKRAKEVASDRIGSDSTAVHHLL
jgi:hypothetical protein